MGEQLQEWRGEFGEAYTDRNVVSWESRVETFRRIIGTRAVTSVAEVGCNRAHNLVALRHVLGPEATIIGFEPQEYARSLARENGAALDVRDGTVYDIPLPDGAVELVFTAGVLIHVPLPQLGAALRELHRVSNRFIVAIEYFAEEETTIPYRGHDNLLWKRDFGGHYRRLFPDLELTDSGDLTVEDGFDRARWWLFTLPRAPQRR